MVVTAIKIIIVTVLLQETDVSRKSKKVIDLLPSNKEIDIAQEIWTCEGLAGQGCLSMYRNNLSAIHGKISAFSVKS